MKIFIGIGVVIVSVLIGYTASGGHLSVLWQPFEFLIIIGSSVGAFIIGNPREVLGKVSMSLKQAARGESYKKEDYVELLTMLFTIIKFAKNKGMLALESHIDNPQASPLFNQFPKFLENERATMFLCDYFRMLTMGSDNPHQMDDIMTEEIETYHNELHQVVVAFQNMADGMPAMGIVAAVLGVIHTMGSISQPPEILGKLIGGALVGTFAGVLLAYGLVGPLSNCIQGVFDSKVKYFDCLRLAILAYLNGYAPLIAVEYARKTIDESCRPTFSELEQAIASVEGAS
ncbi:MAG: flagellar motor stator protein MotA [Alphaproteobacteria bacterium]|nr:flagellar motor stator protein MotA [Alphaproteobacteria bacterium]